jgi:hypothetical protein
VSSKEDSFRITSSCDKAKSLHDYWSNIAPKGPEQDAARGRLRAHMAVLEAAADDASKEPDTSASDVAELNRAKQDMADVLAGNAVAGNT